MDAGDLGAEPEAYAKGKVVDEETDGKGPADSIKRNGINGDKHKEAAVAAGGVPVDGTGHVTNGVSLDISCFGMIRVV